MTTIQIPIPSVEAITMELCALEELPVGLGRAFQIGENNIAVFRTRGGSIFATDNRCPHKGGPLAEGMLAGDQVVCPLHSFRYDLHSGACDQEGACPVKTYPLEIRDGHVLLNLAELTPV